MILTKKYASSFFIENIPSRIRLSSSEMDAIVWYSTPNIPITARATANDTSENKQVAHPCNISVKYK